MVLLLLHRKPNPNWIVENTTHARNSCRHSDLSSIYWGIAIQCVWTKDGHGHTAGAFWPTAHQEHTCEHHSASLRNFAEMGNFLRTFWNCVRSLPTPNEQCSEWTKERWKFWIFKRKWPCRRWFCNVTLVRIQYSTGWCFIVWLLSKLMNCTWRVHVLSMFTCLITHWLEWTILWNVTTTCPASSGIHTVGVQGTWPTDLLHPPSLAQSWANSEDPCFS